MIKVPVLLICYISTFETGTSCCVTGQKLREMFQTIQFASFKATKALLQWKMKDSHYNQLLPLWVWLIGRLNWPLSITAHCKPPSLSNFRKQPVAKAISMEGNLEYGTKEQFNSLIRIFTQTHFVSKFYIHCPRCVIQLITFKFDLASLYDK